MATLTVPTTAQSWIERLARAGYVAKGAVYLLIGVLALQAASGAGGRTTGTAGVFQVILRQPLAALAALADRGRAGRLRGVAPDLRRGGPRASR